MSDEDEQEFKAAEECHICGQKYGNTDIRVRDHCTSLGSTTEALTRTVI